VVQLPVEVEDVDAAWLSGVLGARVTRVDVVARHSGTTGRARLALVHDGGAQVPRHVFVKLAPFDERQRRFVDAVGLGVAEARFYRELAPAVPVRVPRVLHAATDPSGGYVMVLEDLVATGCRFPHTTDDDLPDLVAGLLVELAALHGTFARRALDDDLAWLGGGGRQSFEGGGRYIGRALERFGDDLGRTFRRLAELYVRETVGIAALYARGRPTLVHGDPHLGNLFVDGERVGCFDWGMVMRRTGMWDVAYVLCNSVPTETRREHERDWLALYRDALRAHGVELSADDAWEQYRLLAVYSWSSATSTAAVGSRWQAEEVGHGGMRRATAAVEDLDSVALLESLLA
jgi:hypothetical protein